MKKFLSILLSFVMLFSLAMPAMAAEPTVSGGTEGEVSGTYTPEIAFTGMELETLGQYESRYDAASKTYTIIIPVGQTQVNYVEVYVVGNNLTFVADDNTDLILKDEDGYELPQDTVISILQNNGMFVESLTNLTDGTEKTLSYSNDGGRTWTTYTFKVKQAYSITNGTTDTNGTVNIGSVDTDLTYAIEGDTVNLTVAPADGYALDELSVVDASGNAVTVTDNAFTMPASAVTVTATFKEAETSYTVTVPDNFGNGSVTADPTSATAGTTITLTVMPDSGYELDALTITSDTSSSKITPTRNSDGTYSFGMPAENVTISATFKKITYYINIGTFTGGKASASPNPASEGDTVTITVESTTGYQYKVNSLSVTNDTTGEAVTVDEDSKSFKMPASSVTVTVEFEVLSTTSASIVWGNLSYTYTNDNGWKNNSSDADAGTVTVANTGTNSFYTSVVYVPEIGYSEIEGEFDNGVTQLAANASQSFKLTLKNKPASILDNKKIGTVTVQISETQFDDSVAVVSTDGELEYALANGASTITLSDDISMTCALTFDSNVKINLNGYSLTIGPEAIGASYSEIAEDITVNISGGTLTASFKNEGNLNIDSCTFNEGFAYGVFQTTTGAVKISGTTINADMYCSDGTIELASTVTMSTGSVIHANGGTYLCYFDPTDYVGIGSVTNKGDGTWTVQ